MISFYRIGAVVFRHLMTLKRLSWFVEVCYWTGFDIVLFGLVGKATTMMIGSSDNVSTQILITNAVLWYLVLRNAVTIGFVLLNELFDANLISLFATPLRKIEWLIAGSIVGGIAAILNLIIGMILVALLFNSSILSLGIPLVAMAGSLLLSGWILGMILMSFLFFSGKKGVGMAFVICWSLVPFSCVYYPLEVFPLFLQKIVWFIPMTHIFTATRTILITDGYVWMSIAISYGLNFIYLILASAFFVFMFNRSKKRGLARLELGW